MQYGISPLLHHGSVGVTFIICRTVVLFRFQNDNSLLLALFTPLVFHNGPASSCWGGWGNLEFVLHLML